MMKFGFKKHYLIILAVTVVLALSLFFRFRQFGQIPPGLNRDEASIGYTAFSILKTGRDEYGSRLPVAIKSFGDWKLPGYVYLTIPFVEIFGLNDWSVRLLSALAGLGTILIVFFLTKNIFKDKNGKIILALTCALVLSLLPWHLHFSRAAYEANLALFFACSALLAFIKGLKTPGWLIFSAFLAGLTLLTYHTYQIFIPLLFLGLAVIYRRRLIENKLRWYTLASISLFLAIGLLAFVKTFSANQVKSSISFVNDPLTIYNRIELPRQATANQVVSRLIYNKPVVYGIIFVVNYLESFSPNFLAIEGGAHPIHNFPGVANIFWFEYPLFLAGIYLLFRQKTGESKAILWWLLITPIASSLTKDAPSTVRLSPMILPICVAIGLTIFTVFSLLKKTWQKSAAGLIYLIIISLALFSFNNAYFNNFPKLRAADWGGGYSELTDFLNSPENQNKPVVFERPNYSPYIWLLFYSHYDPSSYQQQANRFPPTTDGFYHVAGFSRYEFSYNLKVEEELNRGKIVVIWADDKLNNNFVQFQLYLVKTVNDYGQNLFYVFEKNQISINPEKQVN
jgi:hypothetical protein